MSQRSMTLWPFIWIRWQEISTLIESLFQEWHCSTFTRHGWPQVTACFYEGSHWFWARAVSILNSKLNSITWLTEHPQHQQTQSLPFKHNLLNYPMEFFCQINLRSCQVLPDQVKHQNSKTWSYQREGSIFQISPANAIKKTTWAMCQNWMPKF